MGKRKKSSRKPDGPRKADPLPTTLTCLFCNHEKSVTVKLDRKAGVGQLDCRVCGQKFQCAVNYLSAAVDVYGEWVDAAGSYATSHVRYLTNAPPSSAHASLVRSLTPVPPDAVAKEDTGKTGHGRLASISGSSKRDYYTGRSAAGESDDGHHAGVVAIADDEPY